jgi:DNA topoisomerase-1
LTSQNLVADPTAVSDATTGLVHVSDEEPGIARRRRGKGWSYTGPDGEAVGDEETIARIAALVIPPAWTDVWICPDPDGHIQATGRDAAGRKQYRYSDAWTALRGEAKFGRMRAFGLALPKLRRQVDRDLRRTSLSRERVCAGIVRLMDETSIRVGNEEYARRHESYGATTLLKEHVEIVGASLILRFRGKSGREHELKVTDSRLVRLARRLLELPGDRFFQYEGSRQPVPVTAADANAYLRAACGADFSVKDFRTWRGSVLAARLLATAGAPASPGSAQAGIREAVDVVADALGNTPTVCRASYIHPLVLERYEAGTLSRRGYGPARAGRRSGEQALLLLLDSARSPKPRRTTRSSGPRRRSGRARPRR